MRIFLTFFADNVFLYCIVLGDFLSIYLLVFLYSILLGVLSLWSSGSKGQRRVVSVFIIEVVWQIFTLIGFGINIRITFLFFLNNLYLLLFLELNDWVEPWNLHFFVKNYISSNSLITIWKTNVIFLQKRKFFQKITLNSLLLEHILIGRNLFFILKAHPPFIKMWSQDYQAKNNKKQYLPFTKSYYY